MLQVHIQYHERSVAELHVANAREVILSDTNFSPEITLSNITSIKASKKNRTGGATIFTKLIIKNSEIDEIDNDVFTGLKVVQLSTSIASIIKMNSRRDNSELDIVARSRVKSLSANFINGKVTFEDSTIDQINSLSLKGNAKFHAMNTKINEITLLNIFSSNELNISDCNISKVKTDGVFIAQNSTLTISSWTRIEENCQEAFSVSGKLKLIQSILEQCHYKGIVLNKLGTMKLRRTKVNGKERSYEVTNMDSLHPVYGLHVILINSQILLKYRLIVIGMLIILVLLLSGFIIYALKWKKITYFKPETKSIEMTTLQSGDLLPVNIYENKTKCEQSNNLPTLASNKKNVVAECEAEPIYNDLSDEDSASCPRNHTAANQFNKILETAAQDEPVYNSLEFDEKVSCEAFSSSVSGQMLSKPNVSIAPTSAPRANPFIQKNTLPLKPQSPAINIALRKVSTNNSFSTNEMPLPPILPPPILVSTTNQPPLSPLTPQPASTFK